METQLSTDKLSFFSFIFYLSLSLHAQSNPDTLGTDLITAVLQRNSKLVTDLLNRGADVNYSRNIKYDGGKIAMTPSPLSQAAAVCSLDIVQILVSRKANVNFQWQGPGYDSSRATPLMLAARVASVNPECDLVIDFLVKSGADPLIPNALGEIPLHALVRGYLQNGKSLDRLLQAAVYSPEQLNRALSLSILNSDSDSIQKLLSAGANPNSPFTGLGPQINNFEAALRARADHLVNSSRLVIQYLLSKGGTSNRAIEIALGNEPSFRAAFVELLINNNFQPKPENLDLAIQNSLSFLKNSNSEDAVNSLNTIKFIAAKDSINVNPFLVKAISAQQSATGSFEILSLLTKAPSFNNQSQEAIESLCYAKERKLSGAEQILRQAGVKENCKQ